MSVVTSDPWCARDPPTATIVALSSVVNRSHRGSVGRLLPMVGVDTGIAGGTGVGVGTGRRPRQEHDDPVSLVRLSGRVQKVVRSAPTAVDLLQRLNRLLTGRGVKVTGLRFARRELVRRFSSDRLSRADARRTKKGWRRLDDTTIEVSLRRNRRVLGTLAVTVSGELTGHREAVIEAVSDGIAVAAHEMLLLASHENTAEWRAYLAAQQRIMLSALTHQGLMLRTIRVVTQPDDSDGIQDSSRSPVPYVLEALDLLAMHVEWASVAADLVPSRRRALPSSLHRLTRWLDEHSDLHAFTEVKGRRRPLEPAVARALYAAAYECLTVVHGLRFCSRARVELRFGEETVLTVVDDSVGQRPSDRLRESLDPVLAPIGARLDVKTRRRGVSVSVTVPKASALPGTTVARGRR